MRSRPAATATSGSTSSSPSCSSECGRSVAVSGAGSYDHGGASITDAWEAEAEAWVRWARTPGVDDYYEHYNLPNFLELLPAPGRRTVEIARLLAPDGVACAAIVHPLASSGFPDPDGEFQYVGRYLDVMRNEVPAERLGVEFTFHSAHRPIELYSRAFESAGLVIEALREPALTEAVVEQSPRLARHRLLPNFLHLRLRHAVR